MVETTSAISITFSMEQAGRLLLGFAIGRGMITLEQAEENAHHTMTFDGATDEIKLTLSQGPNTVDAEWSADVSNNSRSDGDG